MNTQGKLFVRLTSYHTAPSMYFISPNDSPPSFLSTTYRPPGDWSNREFVKERVRLIGTDLKYASTELKQDKELVRLAVGQDWRALEHASEELRADDEVIMSAENIFAIQFVSKNNEYYDHNVKQLADSINEKQHIQVYLEEYEKLTQRDTNIELVQELIKIQPTIAQLKNSNGQKISDIASPGCKNAIETALHLFKKIDVLEEKPIHKSRTATVLCGVDVATTDGGLHKESVVLKCMHDVNQVSFTLTHVTIYF